MEEIEKRNKEIRKLNKKGMSYAKIARSFDLHPERVRQICLEVVSKEEVYKRLDKISKEMFYDADYNWIREEIADLIPQSRKRELVIRRRNLVRFLHDKHKMPLSDIAGVLERHHATILNLYKK